MIKMGLMFNGVLRAEDNFKVGKGEVGSSILLGSTSFIAHISFQAVSSLTVRTRAATG
jgi:hypothetical protein